MACREGSVDFLRNLGYTTIQLPRERIQPLDLIGRLTGSAKARQLGSLTRLVVTEAPAPAIGRDEAVGEVAGRKTDRLDIGTGLRLLSRFLSALGPFAAALEAAFGRARQVEFFYEDVLSDSVEIIDLRGYLGKRPPLDHTNPVIDDYFLGDGQVAVITRTLKSNAFGVAALDESGNRVNIDVDLLGEDLARAGIDASKTAEMKVSFRGAKHLVFAFQGLLLRIDTGGLRISDEIPAEMGFFAPAGAAPGQPQPVVLTRHGLLSLE